MLFGDEKRFNKGLVASGRDPQVMAVQLTPSEGHIGPGSYFSTDVEEKRGGWKKSSFSRREPMTPTRADANIMSRSDLYTHGVVTSYGAVAVPLSSPKATSPGPGYYDRDIFKSHKAINAPKSPGAQSPTPRTPGKSRFAFDSSAVLRDGVLFVSRENNRRELGPGQYSTPMDTMSKPSFNVRSGVGKASTNLSPNGMNGSFRASAQSTPNSRAKSAPRMR